MISILEVEFLVCGALAAAKSVASSMELFSRLLAGQTGGEGMCVVVGALWP